jgi:hypothetical protein
MAWTCSMDEETKTVTSILARDSLKGDHAEHSERYINIMLVLM